MKIIHREEQGAPSNNTANLAAFFERHRPGGVSFCQRILRDRHAAEDIYQDACARLQVRERHSGKKDGNLTALLFTTLKNLCITHLRKRIRRNVSLEQISQGSDEAFGGSLEDVRSRPPDEQLQRREYGEQLEAALRSMDPRLKKALILKEVQGWSYQEISTELKISLSNVGVLIYRAREQLRKLLEKEL